MSTNFDEIIQAHSRWKNHLKRAIETGQSDYSVSEAANAHRCQFGQWLDSSTGKSIPDYNEVTEMHQKFHEEAARILELAISGKKAAALESMVSGSPFAQLTAQLIYKLGDIKRLKESS